ncbi:MAG TPA: hypothetical protein VFH48_43165 [Chloroflexota bacterium]|nr:hypothetical protein [Chloroflexota bacterium]
MKVTIEIPDELYRRVKAKSALEGRSVRAVAIELFERWLEEDAPVERRVVLPIEDNSEETVWARRRATKAWLDKWLQMGEEAFKDAPPGPTAREILDADRSRLEL